MIIPGSADSSIEPGGDGCFTITVSPAGTTRLTGSLADGTRISQSGTLSKHAQWGLYSALYRGQGSVVSWITFTNGPSEDLNGRVSWIKPGGMTGLYPAGFELETMATGSWYDPPLKGNRVLDFTKAVVVLSGGGLAQNLTNSVKLSSKNNVTSANNTLLTFTLATGSFSGSVAVPGTTRRLSFNGVVLQKQNLGKGFFLGTSEGGEVRFSHH